jgi:NAD(P)-dependent dehydrogenase (short-subunit alcohol dehydrogenase family)
MLNGLRNKRVVVTAAASGIGRAVAQAFIAAHARVHVCDISADALSEFRSREPGLSATVADVSDLTAVDRFFDEALRELGGLDVLINNAGIAGPTAPVEDVTPEAWNRTMAVNLTGQFYCVRRAVPLLKQAGGGSIINIASTAGIMGYPLRTPYATSKWAVVGLTKSLAMELGPSGIRVNAVCPGSIEGERMQQVIAAEAQVRGTDPVSLRKSYEKQNSLRTLIAPEDIANMILFTCSDAGAKISGQALSVDGNTETLNN